MSDALLSATEIRELASSLDLTPTKQWGQNFVIDANTVRSIVRQAEVGADDDVLEVGPGLGSLTLALLGTCRTTTAIEIDERLARLLPETAQRKLPERAKHLTVVLDDALQVKSLPTAPTALVANLPYNVSVPVLLHLLTQFPSIRRALVMVQAEVADRLAAKPGSRIYGVPSVKANWFGEVKRVATVGRNVFWPAPNVDSALVQIVRHPQVLSEIPQSELFACVDAAFSQRRKMLRSALANWAGGNQVAEELLQSVDIDPTLRGEQLNVFDYIKIAEAVHGRA